MIGRDVNVGDKCNRDGDDRSKVEYFLVKAKTDESVVLAPWHKNGGFGHEFLIDIAEELTPYRWYPEVGSCWKTDTLQFQVQCRTWLGNILVSTTDGREYVTAPETLAYFTEVTEAPE